MWQMLTLFYRLTDVMSTVADEITTATDAVLLELLVMLYCIVGGRWKSHCGQVSSHLGEPKLVDVLPRWQME